MNLFERYTEDELNRSQQYDALNDVVRQHKQTMFENLAREALSYSHASIFIKADKTPDKRLLLLETL